MRDLEPFLPIVEVDARDVAHAGDIVARLFEGTTLAVIVRGVFAPEALDRFVSTLVAPGAPPQHPFSVRFEAYSQGMILDHCGANLDAYFAEAAELGAFLARSRPGLALESRVLQTLRALAGSGRVDTPTSVDGRAYAPFTLRRLPPGGLIPPHCEREQLAKPSYHDLLPRIETTVLLSYLVPLATPESGGELAVYDLGPDDPQAEQVYRTRAVAHGPIEGLRCARLDARAGDLLVFDGSRHFHQVLAVGGQRPRWTAGGFLARRRDGAGVYAWS